MVVNGILLDYYGGGSLQNVLDEQRLKEYNWERWAIQIGNALRTIHSAEKTHMDLKPSNVVLATMEIRSSLTLVASAE